MSLQSWLCRRQEKHHETAVVTDSWAHMKVLAASIDCGEGDGYWRQGPLVFMADGTIHLAEAPG